MLNSSRPRWGLRLDPPACAPASTARLVLEVVLESLSWQSPCGRQFQAELPRFEGNGWLSAGQSSGEMPAVEPLGGVTACHQGLKILSSKMLYT